VSQAAVSRSEPGLRHYAHFGIRRAFQQASHALGERRGLDADVALRLERLRRDEARVAELLGPVEGRRILVIGPGQLLREARYFALRNEVTAVDLDVIARDRHPVDYLRMLRRNGAGRVAKTLGRKLLGSDRAHLAAWRRALGVSALRAPSLVVGDICDGPPEEGAFDAVLSWSVFQHLPDPAPALRSACRALRPGGVLYTGIHLYTSNTGHHDIRAFTGGRAALPPWGHLRGAVRSQVRPSAFLNEWRLGDWRELFQRLAPGCDEFQERYGEEELCRRLTPALRGELADYTDEELFTVDLFYRWQKP
jgi:SAM-dependent methyltransferase